MRLQYIQSKTLKMSRTLVPIIILSILLPVSLTMQGIDISTTLPTSTYNCIHQSGNLFVIVQTTSQNGTLDPNSSQNLYNAAAGGLLTDIKMIPCRGRNAITQTQDIMGHVKIDFWNTLWVDVRKNTNVGCEWEKYSRDSNCMFLLDIARVVTSKKQHFGILSDRQSWIDVFGNDSACKELAAYELWYSNNNKQADFSDFAQFGGWEFARLKQYQKDATICGAKVNRNYHPNA